MAKYKNIFLFFAIIGTSSAAYFDNTPANGGNKFTHGSISHENGEASGAGTISEGHRETNSVVSSTTNGGSKSRPGTVQRPINRPGISVEFQISSDDPVAISALGSSAVGNKEGYSYNAPADGQTFLHEGSTSAVLGGLPISDNGIGSRPSVSDSRPGSVGSRPSALNGVGSKPIGDTHGIDRPLVSSGLGSRPSVSNGVGSRPGIFGEVSSKPSVSHGFSSLAGSNIVGDRPGAVKRPSSRPGSLVGFQSPSGIPVEGQGTGISVGSSDLESSVVGSKEGYSYNAPANGQTFMHEESTSGALGGLPISANGIGSRPSVSDSIPGVIGSKPSVLNEFGSRPTAGISIGSSITGSTNGFGTPTVFSGLGSRPSVLNGAGSRPGIFEEGSSKPSGSSFVEGNPGTGKRPSSRPGSSIGSGASGASVVPNKEGYSYNIPTNGQALVHEESESSAHSSSSVLTNGIDSKPSSSKYTPGVSNGVGSRPSVSNGVGSRPGEIGGVSNGLSSPVISSDLESRPTISNAAGSTPGHFGGVISKPDVTNGLSKLDGGSFGRPIGALGTAEFSGASGSGEFVDIGGMGGLVGIGPVTDGIGSLGSASGLQDDDIPDIPVDPIEALFQAIPGGGTPGIDYPILSIIPKTEFICDSLPGYYADTGAESLCQVFHICQEDGRHDSFLCPNGTLFNQKYLVCDWWFNVDCSASALYYELNAEIGLVLAGTSGLSEQGSIQVSSGSLEVANDVESSGVGLFAIADDPSIIETTGSLSIDASKLGVHASGSNGIGTLGDGASKIGMHGISGGLPASTGSAIGLINHQAGSAAELSTPGLSDSGILIPPGTNAGLVKPFDISGSFGIVSGGSIGEEVSEAEREGASLGQATGFIAPGSTFGVAGTPSISEGGLSEAGEIGPSKISSHRPVAGIAGFGQSPSTLYGVPVGVNEHGNGVGIPSTNRRQSKRRN